MNLFSIVPDRFFSVLASPLKEHYAGILYFIRAREMGVEEMEDFLKLIYAAAYGNSRLVNYRVDFNTGRRVSSGNGRFEFKDALAPAPTVIII